MKEKKGTIKIVFLSVSMYTFGNREIAILREK